MSNSDTLQQQLVRRLNRWTPRKLRHADSVRARVFVYTVALGGAFVSTVYAGWVFTEPPPVWVHITSAILMGLLASSVRVLHRTRRVAASVNLLLAAVFGLTLAGLLFSGGIQSTASPLLLAEGLAAIYFLERRWQAFWMALVGAGYGVLAFVAATGLQIPQVIIVPEQAWMSVAVQVWLLAQVGGMLMMKTGDEVIRKRNSEAPTVVIGADDAYEENRPTLIAGFTEDVPLYTEEADVADPSAPDIRDNMMREIAGAMGETFYEEASPTCVAFAEDAEDTEDIPKVAPDPAPRMAPTSIARSLTEEMQLEPSPAPPAPAPSAPQPTKAPANREPVVELAPKRTTQTASNRPPMLVAAQARILELETLLADLAHELEAARKAPPSAPAPQPTNSSAFLASLSREIRTPLNATLGALDILHGTTLATDQRRLVETSRATAQGLHGLLSDLIDHTESGQHVAVDRKGFRLQDTLDEVRDARSGLALGLELSFEVSVDNTVPELIEGDAQRIRQVLFTLVDNAFRTTTDGGVSIDVRAADKAVRFRISDTGPGIPESQIDQVFEPFHNRSDFDAAGLGVSICKRVVDAMDGDIGVTSSEGVGTTYWFEIPLVHATQAATERPSNLVVTEVPRGLRALLVEDNPVNRMVAQRLLQHLDITVESAVDGKEAIQRLEDDPNFDLVLMDLHMPRMNGIDATVAIRASKGPAATIPIIAVTADAHADQRSACLEAGMDDHVTKPFRADDLKAALLRTLRRRSLTLVESA